MSAAPVDFALWADACVTLLPTPHRREALPGGGWLLVGGDPALVVLRLTAAGLRIGPARLRFWGAKPVLVEERLAAASWALLPATISDALLIVQSLVDGAVALRRAELQHCGRCSELRAPEEVAIVAETRGDCPFCLRAAVGG